MDKVRNNVNSLSVSKSQTTKYILPDSENLNFYLWVHTQEKGLSNTDFLLLLMNIRSKRWNSLFNTLVDRLDTSEILTGLICGKLRLMVPIDIRTDIEKIDSNIASKIEVLPPEDTYNLVLLDDDFCSVHYIEPLSCITN